MLKYSDAHCHLLDAPDIDSALSNARACGVNTFVVAPDRPSQWSEIIKLTNKYPFVFGAVGVHPWYACELPQDWSAKLQQILIENPKIMVGEIGLDKNHSDMDLQIDVFTHQLKIAHNFSRGIHLHCVGCWDRVLQILEENKDRLPPFILAHGFNGRAEDIEKIADRYNIYFSYGPRELQQRLCASRILKTPLSRILVESDGIDSCVIPSLLQKISEILNVETVILTDIIHENTKQIL